MALPCYVSTEWVGLGHATLRFRSKKMQVVERSSQAHDSQAAEENAACSLQPGEVKWSWLPLFWDYGIPLFSCPKKDKHLVGTHKIECYLSAVYIGEYGERKDKVSKGYRKTTEQQKCVEEPSVQSSGQQVDMDHQDTVDDSSVTLSEGGKDDLRPPGVGSEVWNAWLVYWEAWKEVLIPLSWVHKYRDHCKPEYITWHDSYLEDYPEVLSLITDELGSSELHDNTVKQSPACQGTSSDNEVDLTDDSMYEESLNGSEIQKAADDKSGMNEDCGHTSDRKIAVNADDDNGGKKVDRNVLDDLYTKHIKKRYLVHLRSYLHSSGVECGQDIDTFFKREAGNDFKIQITSEACSSGMNATEELSNGLKRELSQSEECTWNFEENNCSRDKAKWILNRNMSLSCGTENDHRSQEEQMDDTREATLENAAETSIHKELYLNTSFAPQELGDSGKECCHEDLPCEDKETEPHVLEATEGVTHSSGSEEDSVHDIQNDVCNASTSSIQKDKMSKRRRKTDAFRPKGIGWTLKHVQKRMVSQDKAEAPQHYELPSVPHESCEAVLEPQEATSEVLPVYSEEKTCRIYETDTHTSDADPGTTSREGKRTTLEEYTAVEDFFDMMLEIDKKSMKTYFRSIERKTEHETVQRPPTSLGKLLTICCVTLNRAAVSLEKILLSFAALHFLNLALPGAAVVEYESSVTEEIPGERERLKYRFDERVYDLKMALQRYLPRITKFCVTTLRSTVVPMSVHHLTNLVFLAASETEHRFPPSVFGVWWLPQPDPSLGVEGKNIKRQQRRLHRWLEVQNPNLPPLCTVQLRGLVMHRVNADPDPRKSQRVYQQVVKEENQFKDSCYHLTLQTLYPLSMTDEHGGSNEDGEVEWPAVEITFSKDGNFYVSKNNSTSEQMQDLEDAEVEAWNKVISCCQRLSYWESDRRFPLDFPKDIQKYWAQRYRLFLNYDKGIKLDNESWYSVTPEFLAAHQARRCRCEVVVDAMCGAGGNAIQLAKTCGHVIAIDKDPRKVELARHNAEVYGVADRIEFRVGSFFKLAPYLKADVVYLSPPWGGMEYLEEDVYNVYRLGGTMNCAHLLRAARSITPNVALYLPRNSDLCQVIALAGVDGAVDIENNFMGSKKKAITVYLGDLAAKCY